MKTRLYVEAYRDDFRLVPTIWFHRLEKKEAQEYFGYVWGLAMNFFWWEILFYRGSE